MTTPEDQKAAGELLKCPFCSRIAYPDKMPNGTKAACLNEQCEIYEVWMPIAQWNTRPREKELEEELAAANEYNDTDRPLSEVMAAISDAVMDFHPDVESASAGTLIERVETAAELARKASERERRLEELLRRALPACEYSAMKWKDKEGREDRVKLPSEINAALEGKR